MTTSDILSFLDKERAKIRDYFREDPDHLDSWYMHGRMSIIRELTEALKGTNE